MNLRSSILLVFIVAATSVVAQQRPMESGSVSFITSQNVYVRMSDASLIEVGDTLFIQTENQKKVPCLIVSAKSSISCVTVPIGEVKLVKGAEVQYLPHIPEVKPSIFDKRETQIPTQSVAPKDSLKVKKRVPTQRINGRLSAASYSSKAANSSAFSHRLVERFMMNVDHIGNSNFSLESYANVNQNIKQRADGSTSTQNLFKVYNLALIYEKDDNYKITVGRKINQDMSSLGSVDGIQFEKTFNHFSTGVIAGTKPDFGTFGFNSDLRMLGGYVAHEHDFNDNFSSSVTLGFIDQANKGKTDRRYAYLQQQTTLFGDLSLFVSSELDLYSGNIDTLKQGARLTNLFASARYRFNSNLSFMLSYDQRKRVIYYESYQMEIDQILKNDITTTGWRARVNYKVNKSIYTGINYNARSKDGVNTFSNIGGYVNLSNLPLIPGSINASFNNNHGAAGMSTSSLSTSYRTSFLQRKMSTYVYYRYVSYHAANLEGSLTKQNYYGCRLTYNLSKTLSLGMTGEYSYNNFDKNYRFNTQIIKRFR